MFFFFNDAATTEIYTLSLHDALPISLVSALLNSCDTPEGQGAGYGAATGARSEEHTSELQSHSDLVCRLLLEKKKIELQHQRLRQALVGGDDGDGSATTMRQALAELA